ncbi:MAG: UrcA family protein [Sphingomonadales bacterium]|nr:UrcA family protein [Sphingomonadales bacterium]
MFRTTLASLSLAAAVLAATPALAAPVGVEVTDLDLSSKAGKQELARRIDRAAQTYCVGQTDTGSISTSQSCKEAVREELRQKLAGRITAANRMASAR